MPTSKEIDINALGQAIDTTWGRSSTPLTATTSIKMQLMGAGLLKVVFNNVVTFRSQESFSRVKASCADEATRIINETMKNVKATYKANAHPDCKGTLSLKETSSNDSVEMLSMNVYNPKRTAKYCRTAVFEFA
jgi:hypothetical protein